MESAKATQAGGQAPRRMLIGDFAPVKFEPLIEMWGKQNIKAETVTAANMFLDRLKEERFDLAIVNLLLGGIGPNKLIKDVRAASANKALKVVVVSKQVHRLNIENAIKAGADDFIAEPFEKENVYHRVMYHLSPKQVVEGKTIEAATESHDVGKHRDFIALLLKAVEVLARADRESAHSGILRVLQDVAARIDSNRTSLILIEDADHGVVLASSDDPNFQDFQINLSKYPEVSHVANTGQIVLIDDVAKHEMTQEIKTRVKTIQIGSIMVFPVRFQAAIVGVLVIRRPSARELPPVEILTVLQAVANILASHSNIKMLLRKIYSDFGGKG